MASWWVTTTGSDANGGTSEADAKLTPQAGLNLLSAGDTLNIKAGTYTITAGLTITAAQCGTRTVPTIIRGYVTTPGDDPDPASGPLITTATNSVNALTYQAGTATAYLLLRALKITNTAATRGSGILGATGAGSVVGHILFDRVEISGCSTGFAGGSRVDIAAARKLTIRGSTTVGTSGTAFASGAVIEDSRFIDNTSHGCDISNAAQVNATFRRCVFSGNAGSGLMFAAQTRTVTLTLYECTFEGNGSDGLSFTFTTGALSLWLRDCTFYGNGGYGANVSGSGGGSIAYAEAYSCAYGSNTILPSQGLTQDIGAKTLTADPFTNAAAEDWAPNNTAGGGALLRGAGAGAADIGAIQHADSGGGGSSGGYIIGA